MAILTHDSIVAEMKKGRIRIEPLSGEHQVREASVDLRLGNTFRVFRKTDVPVEVTENADYRMITDEVESDGLIVAPGQTVLGVTVEKITLPTDICAWIEGRSRFARLGLLIHISAGLIQPGISNHQVLEITNLGPNPLMLRPGEYVCQLVFQQTIGTATYGGKFKSQTKP